ncbi:hypothetical protein [Enterobacter hormaechei]|uniref:hypothetical protein n=1 Tax=Enterobacter hormaechei TaxID=158836 RepID=UPI003F42BE8A
MRNLTNTYITHVCISLLLISCVGCSATNLAKNKKTLTSTRDEKVAGIALENIKHISNFPPTTSESSNVKGVNTQPSHLTQCKRDLESLHRISPFDYDRYRNEYDALMRSSAGFMAVSGDISDEVNDLARPRFQFALVNLCYRIKNALAKSLISQADGEGTL